jgi:nucleoside-diphosphate-sugar epimerase
MGLPLHHLTSLEYLTMIPVAGGAGFIGANFVLDWLAQSGSATRLYPVSPPVSKPPLPKIGHGRYPMNLLREQVF